MQSVQGTRENPLPTITSATVSLLPGLAHGQSLGRRREQNSRDRDQHDLVTYKTVTARERDHFQITSPSKYVDVGVPDITREMMQVQAKKWVRRCVGYPRTELQEHSQSGEDAGLEGWTITLSLESEARLKAVTKRSLEGCLETCHSQVSSSSGSTWSVVISLELQGTST